MNTLILAMWIWGAAQHPAPIEDADVITMPGDYGIRVMQGPDNSWELGCDSTTIVEPGGLERTIRAQQEQIDRLEKRVKELESIIYCQSHPCLMVTQ